jgi:hypothetical protein
LKRTGSLRTCPSSASGQANDSGETLESSIEAQNSLHTAQLHDRKVCRISRRQALSTLHDLLGSFDCRSVHWEDFTHNSK